METAMIEGWTVDIVSVSITAAIAFNMILKMMYQFTFTELFSWVTWMKLQVLTSDHSLTAFSTLTLVSVTTVTYPLVSTLTSCSCSLSWLLLARSSSSETVSRVVTIPKPLIRNQGHAVPQSRVWHCGVSTRHPGLSSTVDRLWILSSLSFAPAQQPLAADTHSRHN